MLCGSDWMPRHRFLPHMIRAQLHEVDLLNRWPQFGNRTKQTRWKHCVLVAMSDSSSLKLRIVYISAVKPADNIKVISSDPSFAQASLDGGEAIAAHINDGSTNRNPDGIGFWALVSEDYITYQRAPLSQGFWALFWHRFGNARMSIKPKLLRVPASLVYKFGFKLSEWACGVSLPYTIPVGRRVKIEHFGGIIIAARAIGNDVVLRQNTTCGVSSVDEIGLLPTIGDGVDIGVGVAILGDVKVGKKAKIGANAVVLHDVEPQTTVVGVPAKPLPQKTSEPLHVASHSD